MMAFDTNFAPIVGQQITLTSANSDIVGPRIDLLLARAEAGDADVIVKGRIGGVQHGARYNAGGDFETDIPSNPSLDDAEMRQLANTPGQELTYLAVPPGSGSRVGIDRDLDGVLDAIDVCPNIADAGQNDMDGDGVGDECDVCMTIANTDQRDTNGDGYGNSCDPDLNNDGSVNFIDVFLWTPFFDTATSGDADFNGDGLVNFVDFALFSQLFLTSPGPSALN